MSDQGTCPACGLPLVELDAYGERMQGCVGCNQWHSLGSADWEPLPEEDILALRDTRRRTRAAKESRRS